MKRTEVMVKRIAVLVASFSLLAVGAWGQGKRPLSGGLQASLSKSTNSIQTQRPQKDMWRPLPDAPSARVAVQADQFQRVEKEGLLPLQPVRAGRNSGFLHGTETVSFGPAQSVTALDKPAADQRTPAFLAKLLNPPFAVQSSRYQPSSNDSLMGRATDAASRIFVTRDEVGNRRVNTSYVVRVLTSVAAQRASRPYWARSNSAAAPFSDLGSTFGNDAGMNLLHEFGPGLRQAMTSHMPSFVSKIEGRILHDLKASSTNTAR